MGSSIFWFAANADIYTIISNIFWQIVWLMWDNWLHLCVYFTLHFDENVTGMVEMMQFILMEKYRVHL